MSFVATAAVIGVGGSIATTAIAAKQAKKANEMQPEYRPYEPSEYDKSRLSLAQMLFNGRMAGAGNMERNIASSGASFTNNVNRNATDSGQALALSGMGLGVTNNAYNDLQTREAGNKYDLLNNLNQGYQAMSNADNKQFDADYQKYLLDVQQKNSLKNAAFQNLFGGIGDLASGAATYGQYREQSKFQDEYLKAIGNQ
jgi:hypothetical protein